MRRLIAGCSVVAIFAALLVSAPAAAAPQKPAVGKTQQHTPAKSAKSSKLASKSAKGKHAKAKAGRGSHAPRAMVIHGQVDGQVIAPEAAHNCVRFVQMNSSFGLTGKGHLWWREAEGRFERAHEPKPGSVMVFKSTRKISSGHVALVREVVDSRHIRIDHSNWSGGRGGSFDLGVEAVDVSAANDWSQVQVWYGPIQDIGIGVYPVHGFILPKSAAPTQVVQVDTGETSID